MKKALLFIIFLTSFFTLWGCAKKPGAEQVQPSPEPLKTITQIDKNRVNIILFLPDSSGTYLVPVARSAAFNTSLERTIIGELLKEPMEQGVKKAMPDRTRLLSITRKEDTIIADFSGEFIENNPGGLSGQTMTVYSIVNSLTEIPGIKKVVLKVNGKSPTSVSGGTKFAEPFKRNRSLFKRDKSSKPDQILKKQMDFESQRKWFDAYLLYSDDENNTYRQYYDDYVKESEDAAARGFITKNFTVGDNTVDSTGNHAKVKVRFFETGRDLNISMVKIEGAWMVDWIPPQQ